jgi:hypothetical protein
MSNLAPLTEAEVQACAKEWYRLLDVHAPMVDILPMLATDGIQMKFPEATLTSLAEFEGWYQGVIRIFFDEVHEVKKCDVTVSGDTATADIIVKWEASVWNPPARFSKRIVLDAYQTWTLKRSPVTGAPVVVTYSVDELKYHEGSATL